MGLIKNIERPSKEEQRASMESYDALTAVLEQINTDYPQVEIEESSEKIKVPRKALLLLVNILKVTSQGKAVSIVPMVTELTTQATAEILGCSRPYVVKLLENGEIDYTLVGRHRRIQYQDVMEYKSKMKKKQRELLTEIMKADEEAGLYDS